ncbi:polyamine acetyltransferase [Rhodotorula paludigena]|uniref:polyamine acetyltransferase n=1 Tax=Rhodotorula paludigena TaxID=86838 RepID=UPI0031713EE3
MALEYSLVHADDIPSAFELETAGFPEDEAASLESLENRQHNAGNLFLGAYTSSPRQLVGYVCSTLTASPTLTHDSMSTHDPHGAYVAIHSVCVDSAQRGKGVASSLLKEYLARLDSQPAVQGARLITHEELVPLYQRAGFALVGPSEVQHGPRPWLEMKVDFPRQAATAADEDVAASSSAASAPSAVQEKEGDVRSPGRLLSWFDGNMEAVVDKESGTNSADLYCPRAECRCLLLRRGTGKWVRGHASDFELPALPRPVSQPESSTPAASKGYWSVSSPLAFENIGFSRNAAPPSSSLSSVASPAAAPSATIKYLTCADCDHGPLGWHDTEGRDLGMEVQAENEARTGGGAGKQGEKGAEVRRGREFLLAVERVRYKV